jgi:hypothetical protein
MKKLNYFRLLISLILLLALPSCTVVQMFQKIFEQTEAISTTVEKKIGVRPTVSYNNNNGAIEIMVDFEQLSDPKMTVLELQNRVQESVAENMDKKPQKLYITINATENQK